ncbi:MAG: vanadium-dependent haloperoxidase [Pyrinomonadaceae bacterium]|nr:vanadium-dependent haloperoxidase [Pyrinomonadaceae bacterium]
MKTKLLRNKLALVVGLSVALLGVPASPAPGKAMVASPMAYSESLGGPFTVTAQKLIAAPGEASGWNLMMAQPASAGDVVFEWNQEAVRLTLLTSSNLAPVQQTRTMAIVQVAMHDAVNGITRKFQTYLESNPASGNASPDAAAIAAAHHALRNLFPTHVASLDTMFLASLAAHGLSVNDPGVGYGQSAAAAILALRATDGAAVAQYPYTAPGAGNPGVWVPLTTAPALLPGWGNVTPWVLRSGSQFRPEAPPALDSEQYARDYNEIKEIGALNSTTRTAEQTRIATFWLASPTPIWNQPLTQLVASQDFDLSTRTRIYALVHLAAADASIACWDAKYAYNFWRPQPAIRRGDEDGNNATTADPMWTPLFATPRHPEYPSGHTANSTAMATILELFFGDAPGIPVTSTVGTITRQWDTFGEGLDEVIEARIYSGIHFRTADEVGSRQGRQVARFVLTHALRPCRKGGSRCS